MVNALDVARYVKTTADLKQWQSKDLQKLVYFTQAWHLAWTGRALFDEPFEAWPDGPVVRSVYAENRYGDMKVSEVAFDEETSGILDAIIAHYAPLGMDKLIALTHADAPWIEARKGLDPDEPSRNEISMKTMLDFYTAQALVDGDSAPSRPAYVVEADADVVRSTAADVIDRWSEGLALLATR
ncbi:Panacea domain-containing protein [Microbacterium halotolerans]|uniref:Panacea domain-containing protein n=1 Tax=Microbacterium halotolerans TaxID=246613 RepID=UPI000E6AD708|nr:type II toxin-antitoxin system antitoxin SocA domain-containing protein [Microbacterium halotolerans]